MLRPILFLTIIALGANAEEAPIPKWTLEQKLHEWAERADAEPEQLALDPAFREVLNTPAQYQGQLLDCISSPTSPQARRFVCLLLVQKVPLPIFLKVHEELLKSWMAGGISSTDLNLLLDRPIWQVNRIALLHGRRDVQEMFANATAQANARRGDPNVARVADILGRLQSGRMRLLSLYSIHWHSHDFVSSFLAMPSDEDQISSARGMFEQFIVRPLLLLAIVGLSVIAVVIWRRRRAR